MTPYRTPAEQPPSPKPTLTVDYRLAAGLAIVSWIWGSAVTLTVYRHTSTPDAPTPQQFEHCMSSLDACIEVGAQLSRTIDTQRKRIDIQRETEDWMEHYLKRCSEEEK